MEYEKEIYNVRALEAMKNASAKVKKQRYQEASDTRGTHMEENKRLKDMSGKGKSGAEDLAVVEKIVPSSRDGRDDDRVTGSKQGKLDDEGSEDIGSDRSNTDLSKSPAQSTKHDKPSRTTEKKGTESPDSDLKHCTSRREAESQGNKRQVQFSRVTRGKSNRTNEMLLLESEELKEVHPSYDIHLVVV